MLSTLAVLVALSAGPVLAQANGTWTATTSGTWGTASNWLNNIIGTGTGFTATFGPDIASDVTVTNNAQRAVGAIVFGTAASPSGTGAWTVTGSNVVMNQGNPALPSTITVNSLGSVTISSVLQSGTANTSLVVKSGAGKLVLTNTANAIGTKFSITGGTVEIANERVLGALPGSYSADQVQLSNNGTLRTTTTATIGANRGITVGSGGGTISVNGGVLTLATRVSGSGNTVTVTGASALTLTTSAVGTNVNWDFAPNPSIRTFFEGANALGTGSVRVRSGVRLTSQNTASGTLANAVTLDNNAGLTARSSGGALAYQNVVLPSSGTVSLNVDDQTTSTLTVASSGSLGGNLTVLTTQGGTNAVGNVFLDGVFSGVGGLVKSGTGASGRVVLRGANTYTGTTAINTGTLQIGNGGTVGSLSPSSVITGSAGATLALNRSDTISSGTHFNSVIGGSINVAQLGTGTVTFAGANTYTGTTTVAAGALFVNGDQALATGPVIVAAGASLGGSGTIGGSVTLAGTSTLRPGVDVGTLTLARPFSLASGANYKWQMMSATGTAGAVNAWDLVAVSGTLSIDSTSADPYRINLETVSGTAAVSGSAASFDPLTSYSWTIARASGGITGFATEKFLITSTATNGTGGFTNGLAGGAFSLVQSGNDLNLVFTANSSPPTVITINVPSGTTQTQTQAGYPLLSGSVPVVKTGPGTLVLDAANTISGSTTIQGGVLKLANASALSATRIVPVAGGTLALADYLQTTVGGLAPLAGGLTDVGSGLVTVAAGLSATDMVAALLTGMGDGSWNGASGITSSVAAASGGSRTVGWLDNGDGSVTFAFAAPGD
ncbi:MAG: beta strand repeat-containing protein, partial [Planctomycetaceae bacterium]